MCAVTFLYDITDDRLKNDLDLTLLRLICVLYYLKYLSNKAIFKT